jgi:hypothetical protein
MSPATVDMRLLLAEWAGEDAYYAQIFRMSHGEREAARQVGYALSGADTTLLRAVLLAIALVMLVRGVDFAEAVRQVAA